MSPRARSRLLRAAPWVLAVVVLTLIARQARTLDWGAVLQAVQAQSPLRFAIATALAATSHLLYGSFDLLARRLLRHRLPVWRTMATAAISYVFNLNFGALVGGMAMRLRMYTRQGLEATVVAEVIALSLITNWLGYLLVGGLVLLLAPPPLPADWPVSRLGVQALGAAMLLGALGYGLACRAWPRRTLQWRELRVTLPGPGVALVQALLSAANWLLIGTMLWVLFEGRIPWTTVLAVLLLASVAGVVTHVPAGLGVTEAVFVAALGHLLPAPQLLAGLLAYRVAYHLLPLAWAAPAWGLGEMRERRRSRGGSDPPAPAGGGLIATRRPAAGRP
jgi:glycosyltransferase 2 family protein